MRIVQILFLIFLMDYFENMIDLNNAIIYASVIIGSLTLCSVIDHTFFWNSSRYGMQIKTAISGLLYNKVNSILILFYNLLSGLIFFVFKN